MVLGASRNDAVGNGCGGICSLRCRRDVAPPEELASESEISKDAEQGFWEHTGAASPRHNEPAPLPHFHSVWDY